MDEGGAFSQKIDYVNIFLGNYKSKKASKLHYWYKSYGSFAKRLDFAYWWSLSGGGSAMNGATPFSLTQVYRVN